jgi:hypothetical protein
MSEAPGKLGGHLAHARGEHIEAALLHDHTRGRQPAGGINLKLLLERFAPAVAVEQDGSPSVGKPYGRRPRNSLCQEGVSVAAR